LVMALLSLVHRWWRRMLNHIHWWREIRLKKLNSWEFRTSL